MKCSVCGKTADRTVGELQLCFDCWKITPIPTRELMEKRAANRKVLIDAIAERRRSYSQLKRRPL